MEQQNLPTNVPNPALPTPPGPLARLWNLITSLFPKGSRFKKVVIGALVSAVSALGGWAIHQWGDRAKPSILITSIGFAGDGRTTFTFSQELADAFYANHWISCPEQPALYEGIAEKEQELRQTVDDLNNVKDKVLEWQKSAALKWLTSESTQTSLPPVTNAAPIKLTAAGGKMHPVSASQKSFDFFDDLDRQRLTQDENPYYTAWLKLHPDLDPAQYSNSVATVT